MKRQLTHIFQQWQGSMICGLGTDIIEISRIKHSLDRFGMHFVHKILCPEEVVALENRHKNFTENLPAHSIAARFAAKEAAVKALGTGFSNGIGLHHVSIMSLPSGQPQVHFSGPALEALQALGATHSHLSISHSRDTACAVVILEKPC